MSGYEKYVIKSFKHNGSLHRVWQQYWLVPQDRMLAAHQAESMYVLVTPETQVVEGNGKKWMSRVPAVTFFIPKLWFNVVALIESGGIRFYCNLASPVHQIEGVLTYIDYDLDVISYPDGSMHVVDRDEYEANKFAYHYSPDVHQKVTEGLRMLTDRIRSKGEPFAAESVHWYYHNWMKHANGV